MKEKKEAAADQDTLSQADIQKGISALTSGKKPHAALETPEGKNNGAEPAVFQQQRKGRA